MTAAIEVRDLRRDYVVRGGGPLRRSRRTVSALRGITLDVEEGELFGLLGPNGAGKTTAIRILSTLLLPTSGTATVLGHDVVRQAGQVRREIGILFGGDRGLYGRVSAWQNLRYFANLYGLGRALSDRRIAEALRAVGLEERAHDRVDTYSRGMKQRLHIARTLIHDPRLVFLDEPTIGLDPIGARELRDQVRRLRAMGKTILLTTHYMFEADELCDRIAIVDHGRLVALASPAELRRMVPDLYVLEIELEGGRPEAVARLRELAGPSSTLTATDLPDRQLVRLQSPRGRDLAAALPTTLAGARVGSVLVREPTLEDVYVRMVEGLPAGAPAVEAAP